MLVRFHFKLELDLYRPIFSTDVPFKLQRHYDQNKGNRCHSFRLGILLRDCFTFFHKVVRKRENQRNETMPEIGQILLYICNHGRVFPTTDYSGDKLFTGFSSGFHPSQESTVHKINCYGVCRIKRESQPNSRFSAQRRQRWTDGA